MDELNTNQVETTETTDEFLTEWDDDVVTDTDTTDVQDNDETGSSNDSASSEQSDATNVAENNKVEESTSTEGVEEKTTTTDEQGTGDAELSWNVKVLGEEKVIKASEVTPAMLQKASDYDRIHDKWNEAKPVMEVMQQFAKNADMDVLSYVRYLREQVKISEGASEESAKHEVELEDKEAELKAREETLKEHEAESNKIAETEKANKERIQADLAEFKNEFPEIYEKAKSDPKQIPQSVWDEVNKGKTLSVAFAKYAMAQAKEEARLAQERANTAEQNTKNASRSTGSMRSAGDESANVDDFLKDW